MFEDVSFFERIDFIADNDESKQAFSFTGVKKPVYSIGRCVKQAKKEPVILITVVDCFDIIEQLESMPELQNCYCFIFSLVRDHVIPYHLPKNRASTEPLRIPQTIHYCWFGGAPIRDNIAAYMESWKKFCPEYEIVRWDESNYDFKKSEHMYEMYKKKIWGLVPDFARLDIIYKYGGVYLDTDVELIRNIDDLLCDDAFCGFADNLVVNNGSGFGAVAGFPLILEQMKKYDQVLFLNEDGSFNLQPGPVYETELLRSKGLQLNNTLQKIQGMTVYPSDVLSPFSCLTGILAKTDNTYSIHHYTATWWDGIEYERIKMMLQKYKLLAEKLEKELLQ